MIGYSSYMDAARLKHIKRESVCECVSEQERGREREGESERDRDRSIDQR